MNSFRLQSNPTAAFAYSQLNKTQVSLNKNIQRLSSGLRINSAADDTAGSAMATRMTNQIRGMHQANRNSRDANNLLATAEAGLNNIGDLLAQMRELSVQAATDTLNDTDRSSIDLEFQSLKNELTRIASVTEHNGMNLLNGTYQTEVISGLEALNLISGLDTITVGDQLGTRAFTYGVDFTTLADLAEAVDGEFNARFTTVFDGETDQITFTSVAPEVRMVVRSDTNSALDAAFANVHESVLITAGLGAGQTVTVNSDEFVLPARGHWQIQIGADNDVDSQHEFSIMNASDVGLEINGNQVLTVDEARTAVTALDDAIDEVNRERSYIGSEQNKLQFTMSNLSSTINSIETARSNIEDVDYAAEMSELSKNQILVQSSTAMLAQANMVSQNVLQLLSN